MLCISLGVSSLACSFSHAADEWDASAGTHWWFNPANWSKDVLPPANDTLNPPTSTDTQINLGTGAWDQGFGVLYDPANDPGFAAAGGMTFPTDLWPAENRTAVHLACSQSTGRNGRASQ